MIQLANRTTVPQIFIGEYPRRRLRRHGRAGRAGKLDPLLGLD
jgi:glutaredoxin